MEWIHRVRAFLETNVFPQDRLLLAVSGGADSMGMLSLFCDELRRDVRLLTVGHVQHGIRAREAEDLDIIREYADLRSVPVVTRQASSPELAAVAKMSLEAAARKLRYQSLEELANESGSRWILTAHTLEDTAETVLMRMQNGGAWYEWTGIPVRRGRVLRPLLGVRREELRRWAAERGVPFKEDETNTDIRHARNRVRDDMASRPSSWNGQRKQELAQLGEMATHAMLVVRSLARVLPVRIPGSTKPRVIGLAIDPIFIYFKGLTFAPVEEAWAELVGVCDARLPSSARRQINDFVAGRGPKAELALPGGIRLIRNGGQLWLTPEQPVRFDRPVGIGTNLVPELNGRIEIGFSGNGSSTRLSSVVMNRPLRVRTWQSGDRLKARGRPKKNVSDLLNEENLNPVVRERTLVLVDDRGPLMIIGGPVDERALPNPTERDPVTVTWIENE